MKVPSYTFHDGFSTYNHLLEGVLPIKLKFIKADQKQIVDRFYKACIGWIRYKPLLLYITRPDDYEKIIKEMRQKLQVVLPKICLFFGQPNFMNILTELEKYDKNVQKHYSDFMETKRIWANIIEHFAKQKESEKID